MPVLIAPGLNGGDGAHSAPTAHIGEPTLPSGGKWDSGDTAAPPPPRHSSKVQIPGDHTRGQGVKYHLKMASYNPSVLNLLLSCWICALFRKDNSEETIWGRTLRSAKLTQEGSSLRNFKGGSRNARVHLTTCAGHGSRGT